MSNFTIEASWKAVINQYDGEIDLQQSIPQGVRHIFWQGRGDIILVNEFKYVHHIIADCYNFLPSPSPTSSVSLSLSLVLYISANIKGVLGGVDYNQIFIYAASYKSIIISYFLSAPGAEVLIAGSASVNLLYIENNISINAYSLKGSLNLFLPSGKGGMPVIKLNPNIPGQRDIITTDITTCRERFIIEGMQLKGIDKIKLVAEVQIESHWGSKESMQEHADFGNLYIKPSTAIVKISSGKILFDLLKYNRDCELMLSNALLQVVGGEVAATPGIKVYFAIEDLLSNIALYYATDKDGDSKIYANEIELIGILKANQGSFQDLEYTNFV